MLFVTFYSLCLHGWWLEFLALFSLRWDSALPTHPARPGGPFTRHAPIALTTGVLPYLSCTVSSWTKSSRISFWFFTWFQWNSEHFWAKCPLRRRCSVSMLCYCQPTGKVGGVAEEGQGRRGVICLAQQTLWRNCCLFWTPQSSSASSTLQASSLLNYIIYHVFVQSLTFRIILTQALSLYIITMKCHWFAVIMWCCGMQFYFKAIHFLNHFNRENTHLAWSICLSAY